MSEKGWIKLDRGLIDNWVYKEEKFDKTHAWLDLILLAEYKTHKKMWRGNLTEFKRGDVCISISALAKRWGWSRDKTRHFLSQLESDNMVRIKATTNRTTISLVKYGVYQDRPTTNKTTKPTTDQTTDQSTEPTYLKNIKNSKEYKEKPTANFSANEEVEMWNGKPVDDLTDEEWVEYVNSWED